MIGRREFIALLSGAASAWPLAARAQRSGPMRRVAFLHGLAESDPEVEARIAAFEKDLSPSDGWTIATFRSSIDLPVAILLVSSNTSRNW